MVNIKKVGIAVLLYQTIKKGEYLVGWTGEQTNRRANRRTDIWTDGQMDGWTDGRMDGWTDGQMD